jgi:hypothetical protein
MAVKLVDREVVIKQDLVLTDDVTNEEVITFSREEDNENPVHVDIGSEGFYLSRVEVEALRDYLDNIVFELEEADDLADLEDLGFDDSDLGNDEY